MRLERDTPERYASAIRLARYYPEKRAIANNSPPGEWKPAETDGRGPVWPAAGSAGWFRPCVRRRVGVRPVHVLGLQERDHVEGRPPRFRGAALGSRALGGYLDLQRPVEDPRITKSAPYTRRLYVLHCRIERLGQLDGSTDPTGADATTAPAITAGKRTNKREDHDLGGSGTGAVPQLAHQDDAAATGVRPSGSGLPARVCRLASRPGRGRSCPSTGAHISRTSVAFTVTPASAVTALVVPCGRSRNPGRGALALDLGGQLIECRRAYQRAAQAAAGPAPCDVAQAV